LVAGAIEGAKELGVSVEDAAAAATDGALKAAGKVSVAAVDVVRKAVGKPLASAKAAQEPVLSGK
jgi:hypothetical protein